MFVVLAGVEKEENDELKHQTSNQLFCICIYRQTLTKHTDRRIKIIHEKSGVFIFDYSTYWGDSFCTTHSKHRLLKMYHPIQKTNSKPPLKFKRNFV